MQFKNIARGQTFALPKDLNTRFTRTVNKYGEPTASTGKRMFTFQPETACVDVKTPNS